MTPADLPARLARLRRTREARNASAEELELLAEAEAVARQVVDQPKPAPDAQAYWQAGFLRGAKWWEGQQEGATMWQSDQNAAREAAADLWHKQRPEVMPPSYQAKFDADLAALIASEGPKFQNITPWEAAAMGLPDSYITAPKPALDALRASVEKIQADAEGAAEARKKQAHAHLTTQPKLTMYDGTAAQVHEFYAVALRTALAQAAPQ